MLSVEEMEAYVRQKYGDYLVQPTNETKATKKVSDASLGKHHELYSFGPGPL